MPLIVVPIRTETAVRSTPLVNYWLIGINVAAFVIFNPRFAGETVEQFALGHLFFQSYSPAIHQFFTYQFLHGDVGHLLGNMLFLWVFGNAVCDKMGGGPYLIFYLACGVFAAWGNAMLKIDAFHLIGASGSIAGITTAYMALFPRSYVTVLVWLFFFVHFFELPAMVIIGLKIIVWDNIVSPGLGGGSEQVAHLAHLGGYLFGFVGAIAMLFMRGVARDQFDILAIWSRWKRRREWRATVPKLRSAAYQDAVDPKVREQEDQLIEQIADLRSRISEDIERRSTGAALELYEKLLGVSPGQCLPQAHQLEVAREYYRRGQFEPAAEAFARFVECYPEAADVANVRLLLGIIHARDLQQYEAAERHLSASLRGLRDDERREQCRLWLENVRAALGRGETDVIAG